MSLNFEFIGWCVEGNHDKVWVCIELQRNEINTTYLTCWGRRGKKLQTKVVTETSWNIFKLIESKRNKGYQEVDNSMLRTVYPDFEKDLAKTAFWASFKI